MSAFPRVTVPGLDPEASALAQALTARAREVEETTQRRRAFMARAMHAIGYRPYLGHVYRAPKPTKNQRHKARMAAAAAVVRARKEVRA